MPELPEVETVRAGLERFVVGRRIRFVDVHHPRSIRRHLPGADDFTHRLRGARIAAACRRGKYLWLPLDRSTDPTSTEPTSTEPTSTEPTSTEPTSTELQECLVCHLGMSGQLLVRPADAPAERHLHVRISFDDDGPELRFVDQRTFGGLLVDDLVPADDVGDTVPALVAHIARDPLDPAFDAQDFQSRLRRRRTGVKRALLDQTLVSGIGNIYADESLWLVRLHGGRRTDALTRPVVLGLLDAARGVLSASLTAGGTSFDALYVNVNGESGFYDRTLRVYGRAGAPCERCGTLIRREAFMNRSSYFCPRCQRRPARAVVDHP